MFAKKNPAKVSFIYYEKDRFPRFFEIKKTNLRFLVYGFPIITFISVLSLATILLYFNHLRTFVKVKEPKIIQDLKLENMTLTKKNAELTDQTVLLQKRLTSTDVPSLNTISLFKPIPGQKDLSATPTLSLENIKIIEEDSKAIINFNVVNTTQGQKISGYLFVIMKVGHQMYFFPKDSIPHDEMKVYFNKGESFTTSRFRPSVAEFPLPPTGTNILLKFIIFSRVGDLMLKKTESYTIGEGGIVQ